MSEIDLDKFVEAKPIEATITFKIPAYTDRNGIPFERTITVPTKKAYAIFKNATKKFIPEGTKEESQ